MSHDSNSISKWDKPKKVTRLDLGFGPKVLSEYLPEWDEIPEDFKRKRGEAKKWTSIIDDWFFNGNRMGDIVVITKEGVDRSTALGHISCILHSYEPKHEHKTAGAAYLLSLWFDTFEYQMGKK